MIIDSHVHVGELGPHFTEPFAAEMMGSIGKAPETITTHVPTLVAEMDAAGINKACLLAFDVERTLKVKVPNEYVAAICHRYPERFIGFCSVDAARPDAATTVHTAVVQLGMRGLKIAPAYLHLSPADQRWNPVYEVAQSLNIPVLVHTGFTPTKGAAQQYFAPNLMEQVAQQFPDLRLILAHLGAPWVMQCLDLLTKYPHVYADLSIFGWYQPVTIVAKMLGVARQRGVIDRLLWGSDHPWGPIGEFRARMDQLAQDPGLWPDNQPLTQQEMANIMGLAARRIIDFS